MVSDAFVTKIREALQELRNGGHHLATMFQDLALFHHTKTNQPESHPRKIAEKVLGDALDQLHEHNDSLAQLIRAFYWERLPSNEICQLYNISSATLSRRQREGQTEIARLIWETESILLATYYKKRLPDFPIPDYKRTFGLKSVLQGLRQALRPVQHNQLLLLVGLGGIGKTTVAFELIRQLALTSEFDLFLLIDLPGDPYGQPRLETEYWELTVNHLVNHFEPDKTLMPLVLRENLVRLALTQQRCLILVDNIESTPVATYILDNLRRIAGQSHFVVTSRNVPLSHIIVHTTEIRELELADARELLAFQLQDQGVISGPVQADILDTIIPITRGHPQAILLVVTMMKTLSLEDVVALLADGRSKPMEELYEDIYERTWNLLSDNAKMLLLTIYTVSPEGGTAQHLTNVSQLSNVDFFSTIQELTRASIIEVRGDYTERSYSLHQLTLNYLHTKFGGDNDSNSDDNDESADYSKPDNN